MKYRFTFSPMFALLSALLLIACTAAAQDARVPAKGYAKLSRDGKFQLHEFTRHAMGENDIRMDILYAGICHSDIHHAHEDWRSETYPMVPGHEIIGRVTQVGAKVTKFKVGDLAGIGCMVNSCGECAACKRDLEQFCESRAVMTYAGKDRFHGGEMTMGGYSNNYVLSEKFAIKVPANVPVEKVAPLFCAGVTTYSALMQTKVGTGDKVAVAGFGGLGHMAVQYAVKMGAEVTVFDITEEKRDEAMKMGAVRYVNVNNAKEREGLNDAFRVIISTIPAKYDLAMYLNMLQLDGEMVILGVPARSESPTIGVDQFVWSSRRKVFGSAIGGIKETQEMLDYSVANNIYPQVEVIPVTKIDEAYQNVIDGKVKFRYVIDMSTMPIDAAAK